MNSDESDDLERLRRDDPELADKLESLLRWVDAAKQERENEALLRLDTEADELAPAFLYQPDTAQPAYAKQAAIIQHLMSQGRVRVVLPKPIPVAALFAGPDIDPIGPTFDVHVLDVKRAAGPAPYVGRPFAYIWDVAIDKQNRWVSGSAQMRYLD